MHGHKVPLLSHGQHRSGHNAISWIWSATQTIVKSS